MKSEQEELIKSQTPCKECSFCEYEDSVQIGCLANRLETFKSLNQIIKTDTSDGKTYSVIDRFCNYFRSQKWKEKNKDKDILEEVKKETKLSFGLVIDCQEHTPEKIKKTINYIKNIDYNKQKITTILHIDGSRDINHLVHMVNVLKQTNNIVVLVSISQDKKRIKDYDIFSKCANRTHFTTTKIGSVIPSGLFSSINSCFNDELAKVVYFESKETDTITLKIVQQNYLKYLNYQEMLKEIKKQSQEANMYGLYEEK